MSISPLTTIPSNLPPLLPGYGGAAITAYQLYIIATYHSKEKNSETAMQYSKFAQTGKVEKRKAMISSQNGMTIIYLPALIISLSISILGYANVIPVSPSIAEIFIILHFLKRQLEVLYLHKYSGKVSVGTSTFIGVYYALISTLICCVASPLPDANSSIIGGSLFAIGSAGNFYHHWKLAQLRKGSTPSAKYIAPKGGLFNYVAAPHYLFELIAWLGIAIASEHGNAFLNFVGMVSLLTGRSIGQNKWNRERFSVEDWPLDRKNIVPFVF